MLFWQRFSKAGGRGFLEAGSGRGFLDTRSIQSYYSYYLLPLLYNCVITSLTELFKASEYLLQSIVGLLNRQSGAMMSGE